MRSWRITWRDVSWADDTVTVAEALAVAALVGRDTWDALDPWSGPQRLVAWLVVLSGDAEGVLGAPFDEVLAAITVRRSNAWPAPRS